MTASNHHHRWVQIPLTDDGQDIFDAEAEQFATCVAQNEVVPKVTGDPVIHTVTAAAEHIDATGYFIKDESDNKDTDQVSCVETPLWEECPCTAGNTTDSPSSLHRCSFLADMT